MLFTIKDGVVYGYDDNQMALYTTRIAEQGHNAATADEVEALITPPAPPITAEGLKEIVTRHRKAVEAGGLTFDGVRIGTTIEDQNRITSVLARNRGIDTFDFEAQPTVWVTMTREMLESIDLAIARHVQASFTAARRHHEAIDLIAKIEDPAARQAALDEYDESVGWPN